MTKCTENAESQIIDSPLSNQPDREHDNPLKPDWTCDDVGKKNLVHAIVAEFQQHPFPKWSISIVAFDFRRICKYGVMSKAISISMNEKWTNMKHVQTISNLPPGIFSFVNKTKYKF